MTKRYLATIIFNVLVKGSLLCESKTTELTFMTSFSSVNTYMLLQSGGISTNFRAIRTCSVTQVLKIHQITCLTIQESEFNTTSKENGPILAGLFATFSLVLV